MKTLLKYSLIVIWAFPMVAFSATEYLDVNLSPTKNEINYRYHYESDVQPNDDGVYTLPVFDEAGELIVTFQSTKPVIARGTFTGTQVAEERKLGLLSRVLYHLGDGFNGRAEMRNKKGYLQEEVPYINGKRDGVAKQYYDNGALNATTHYKQNKEVLTTKRWSRDGVLVRETQRTENGEFVKEREWTTEGVLRQETVPIDIDGYPSGLQETTWELGEVKTFIAAGVRDPHRGFYPTANLPYILVKRERKEEGQLISLKEVNHYGKEGQQRLYHEGFSIIENMSDGKRNGMYSEGDEGNEAIKGMYKNGVKVGQWRDTNSDGDIILETYSNSGNLDGVRTVQNRDTQALIVTEHYVDGTKHGEYAAFDSDGNKETFGMYNQGKKDGAWVEKDGNRIWHGTYQQGHKVERWLGYNLQGYRIFDLHYKNGKLDGPQYAFADNGALTLFEERKNGARDGKRLVYENGIKTSENNYKNGERQP
ncbi:hypothetical protein [Alteromonas sp. C1M14]|uniref:toxin-antitoxin system YwqK family antitoxin n=1 Tax=Alteromonas sp. C1M14 TaxID=2841567 RepID=UPI001C08E693|nr:hypothetical protein [Alteromonas sp. C1M14]MBU2978561.1 hypothetical protein [Alteromonas sp. C1M14]